MNPRLWAFIAIIAFCGSCHVVGHKAPVAKSGQATAERDQALAHLAVARKSFQLLERVFRPLLHTSSSMSLAPQDSNNFFYLIRSLMDNMGLGVFTWLDATHFELVLPSEKANLKKVTIVSLGEKKDALTLITHMGFRISVEQQSTDYWIFTNANQDGPNPGWKLNFPILQQFLTQWLERANLAPASGQLNLSFSFEPATMRIIGEEPFVTNLNKDSTLKIASINVESLLENDSIVQANISGSITGPNFDPVTGLSFLIRKGSSGVEMEVKPVVRSGGTTP